MSDTPVTTPGWRPRAARWVVQSVVAVALAVVMTVGVGPAPAGIGYLSGGDPALVSRVRAQVAAPDGRSGEAAGFSSLAVGLVEPAGTSVAFLGDRGDGTAPDATTTFELASITKTFTAHMLAAAVDSGEVSLSDEVERYLPELTGTPAGSVTMEELATHRGGLPAYADLLAGATYEGFGSADLQAEDEAVVLAQTRTVALSDRGTWQYSNLGVSLLGYALARAAGEPSWELLVRHRILGPLGMSATTFARTDSAVPTTAAQGHRVNGTRVAPVTGGGYLPAGTTTFTTVGDMTTYARALIAAKVPGMWAMDPRYEVSTNDRIGLVWYSTQSGGHEVQYHSGGVPGFSSMLIVDRVAGRAVIVLGGSEETVDPLAFHLLDPSEPVAWLGQSPVESALGILGWVLVAGAVLVGAAGRRPMQLMAAGLAAQVGLLLLLFRGPWHQVPPYAWGTAAALVFWLAMETGRRWGSLRPTRRDRVFGAVTLALTVLLYGAVIWVG